MFIFKIIFIADTCSKFELSSELKNRLLGNENVEGTGSTVIPPTRLFEDHLPSVAYLLHVNINETSSCTVSIINSEWLITSSGCVSNM